MDSDDEYGVSVLSNFLAYYELFTAEIMNIYNDSQAISDPYKRKQEDETKIKFSSLKTKDDRS